MSFFDDIQNLAFDIVTASFGDSAIWLPSDNSPEQTALVLYKDATDKHELSNVDYEIEQYLIEYKMGDFDGLKQSVGEGNNERIRITKDGITFEFLVRRCTSKYDGKTIIAYLNPPISI